MKDKRDAIDQRIDELADKGDIRLRSERKTGFEILPASEVSWHGSETRFLDAQYSAFGNGLDMHYLELLRRAKRLVEHLENNVGEDEEWPILVVDADDQHRKLIHDLTSMVGCLTEL